ncbi:ABC transporter ATP-binding protein [Pontivivens ytuae]|uniref:ABC transporter ATP-binding protein n=1 Tax=Pontivivens ytuae TaxID=2789856 RepID=A0A7S9LV10_9RHOB|nr:ATP-binding cassette domain-containing protein [Pontivivens ytuae]QPH55624.1 ABC transporter ATP-binding protein [Pontivivens ytuae]
MDHVLACQGLTVSYPGGATPVREISFRVKAGECFALVGASGAGKSTIAKALVGLHRSGTAIAGGMQINGWDMVGATRSQWRDVRGRQVGFIAQNPWASCDPLRPVQDHVAEAWRCHGLSVSWDEIAARLAGLGVVGAEDRIAQHPHTWSGGMLQRASIAAAGALIPPLLIADEPTSALDADRAQSVLTALKSLGSAVVLISHDIGLVLRNADRVGVLNEGRLVEEGTPGSLGTAPKHPETQRLLAALTPLPPRTTRAAPTSLLRMTKVSARYDSGRVNALAETDLEIGAGQIVGVQGPSGCGKSTLLRLAMGIERPTGGHIWRSETLARPGAILPVFQDPVGSLVPHWPIWRSVAEPLTAPRRPRKPARLRRQDARAALAGVGLENIDPEARPSELSVGQCQRVALARATIADPAMIVADEPTSALDSPSTWLVGKLLRDAAERGTAVLVVSHDSTFLERVADHVVIMNVGRTLPPAQVA